MQAKYDLIAFDIDGTLCPSGRSFTEEQLKLIDTTPPEQFKVLPKDGFNYSHFQGVEKVVRGLYGRTKLCIISNGPYFGQRNKLILTYLDTYFDPIYISEEFARQFFEGIYRPEHKSEIEKPSPIMFWRMNLETRTLNTRSLYVGNRQVDHAAALIAGWDFIGVVDEDEKYRDEFKKEPVPKKLVSQKEFIKIPEYLL